MSSLYAGARQLLLTAGLTWTTARIAATLVGAAYTPNFETDTTIANLPAGSVLSPSVLLTGLTASGGYAGAAQVNFGALTTTAPIAAILLTLQPGQSQEATDKLLAYINEGVGFGQKPTNFPTSIVWDQLGVFRP
jgi:hypothetical protein